jgi:hypothetical protein
MSKRGFKGQGVYPAKLAIQNVYNSHNIHVVKDKLTPQSRKQLIYMKIITATRKNWCIRYEKYYCN